MYNKITSHRSVVAKDFPEIKVEDLNIKYKKWFRPGMGTENVGPFLQSLMGLSRPERVLEIGVGYTTPFLIEGIVKNNNLFIEDINKNEDYYKRFPNDYDPKIVIIDDNSLGEAIDPEIKKTIEGCNFLEVINAKFQGLSKNLYEKYGNFDFVWFDCGGVDEYESFIKEYWDICSEYVIFHFTYSDGKPNQLLSVILKNISPPYFRLDIIEPHKSRQGSLTVIRKAPVPNIKT